MARTSKQTAASRLNGARSQGPRTVAGKRRSCANGMKHGVFALQHRPVGEPRDLVEDMETALVRHIQPEGPAEERLTHDLASDLLRLRRLEKAEQAALDLAGLDGDLMPRKKRQQILDAARLRRSWSAVKLEAVVAMGALRGGHQVEAPSFRKAAEVMNVALDFADAMKPLDLRADEVAEIHKHMAELSVPALPADAKMQIVSELAESCARILGTLVERTIDRDARRQELERDLDTVPDARTITRFDKYRRMVERSCLCRIEMLSRLRSLRASPDGGIPPG